MVRLIALYRLGAKIMNGLNLLQQYIKEQELTGVILISPINLHYFAGFTGTTGFAIITQIKPL